MYLQRNENSVTVSLLWALYIPHLLPQLLVIELIQTYLISGVFASISELADEVVTLCAHVCVCVRVCVCLRRSREQKDGEKWMSIGAGCAEQFLQFCKC